MEDGGQRTEDGEQRMEDRGQRTEAEVLVRWLHRPLTMAWLHGEGRVVGLVSDSILKVNRSVTGHGKGDGGTAGEGGGGKEGEGEEGEEGRRGRKSEGRGDEEGGGRGRRRAGMVWNTDPERCVVLPTCCRGQCRGK